MAQRLLGYLALASLLVAASSARAASIADCGNINVEANAQCKLRTGVDCTGQCTPINCSASLYAKCAGNCNVTPPSCDVSCSASCEGRCNGSASFDCAGDCKATCGGTCDSKCMAHCSSADGGIDCQANCKASCTATCQGECDVSCNGQAQGSCSGKCAASCQGSCNANAHIDCQAACQGKFYADCTGGCQVNCTTTGKGGIFCDGQYIDYGGNLQSCAEAIQSALNIKVDGYSSSSGSCSGNTCQGEAKAGASASCAVKRPGYARGISGGGLALVATALGIVARRRRR